MHLTVGSRIGDDGAGFSQAAARFCHIIRAACNPRLRNLETMTAAADNATPPFARIGIVGAGLMGRGIAQIAAQSGFGVRLIDSKRGVAAQAKSAIEEVWRTLVGKGKMDAAAAQDALARIELPDDEAALADRDLVIEAIVERLDAKQALFAALERIVAADCVLASNTSSLSVTAIASACVAPQRVAGLHFFSPVPLMKLVEVIPGLLTAPGIAERLEAFARALGHAPVRAGDTPGFIVNHAGRGYGTEALRIAGEGIADFATIDRILKRAAGFRMGPFELLDLTGLDVSHPVMESIYRQFYDEPRFRPSPITAQRLAAGVLGRKTGRGFYRYDAGVPAAADASPATTGTAPAGRVWVGAAEPGTRDAVAALLGQLGARVDLGARPPHDDSLCVVLPLGSDATSEAVAHDLDPARTVALDTLTGLDRHRTLMTTPLTQPRWRDAARALLGADGVAVDVIRDSPGFVCQRVLAHIVNIACDMAQQRIAAPEAIDLGVRIGLAYPQGPLQWGDALSPPRLLAILQAMHAAYGDPRYRPSVWLSRRARLGVSLLTPDT
jgi:3-hydroxybutyryl-CoA dehydrogenase